MSDALRNAFESLSSSAPMESVGWVLVHSVWILTAIGLMVSVAERLVSRASASAAYLVLLPGLLLMLAAPVATWMLIPVAAVRVSPSLDVPLTDFADFADDSNAATDVNSPDGTAGGPRRLVSSGLPHAAAATSEPASAAASPGMDVPATLQVVARWLRPWMAWLAGVWCCGVLSFSFRPVCSWLTIRRLRSVAVSPVSDVVQQSLIRMVERLRIRQRVQVLQSTLVTSPVVIGCFRGVILLPVSLVASLPIAQLEAILAHELAHVRRYDYLVNLLQTLAETLFFYHPAVWWLSHRLRVERENCCDDLVVAALGDRVQYGRALLAVAEHCRSVSALAVGARDGSLLMRTRRLFAPEADADRRATAGVAAISIIVAVCAGITIWSAVSVRAHSDEATVLPAAGPVSQGLQFRLVALQRDANDEAPDLRQAGGQFASPDEMTFCVQLTNVGSEPVILTGIRYGDGFAQEVQGTLRTELLAPHLFDFHFVDETGKAVPRVQRTYFDGWLMLSSASTHELAPGESLTSVLRPAKFHAPMNYDLPPGNYSVRVRYRGPDDVLRDKVRKYWPDKPILRAWPHVVESNSVGFSIAEPSRRTRPEDLVWGQAVAGLQAAVEYRLPDDIVSNPLTAPGVPVGTRVQVVFHVKNVSDMPITFISETSRQGDSVHVTNERGDAVPIKNVWFSGWPIDVAWTLQPGDAAQLPLLTPSLNSLDQPGRYNVRYTIRFNSRSQKDDAGNVIFPRPGDYDRELDTGTTPLYLSWTEPAISANGEIHGRLIDDESGSPVRGATVACGAVINDSRTGGGTSAKTDSLGHYRLPVPSPGIYNVWLKEYRDSGATAVADDGILVKAGQVSTSGLRLTRGRLVTGNVAEADGTPVPELVVSWYSPARPQSGGVQSVRTAVDGSFSFRVPPGRVHVYTTMPVEKTDENPLGIGPGAERMVEVPETGKPAPVTLTLGTRNPKFGSDDWLARSTPGTRVVSHTDSADVTGTVVDQTGTPVAGAQVFSESGVIAISNDRGAFRLAVDRGTQFVMHAFHPGCHLWFGTPTAGDELLIVLEAKRVPVNNSATEAQPSDSPAPAPESPPADSVSDARHRPGPLLQLFIDKPHVETLKRLLAPAAPQPRVIQLLHDSRRGPGAGNGGPLKVVPTPHGQLYIVLAAVAAEIGADLPGNSPSSVPEAAFVFDAAGTLLARLGGELHRSGTRFDADNVDVVSLGPREDWFVRVMNFQYDADPFTYRSTYYRMADPVVHSVRFLHYPNTMNWSMGPADVERWGELSFDHPQDPAEQRWKLTGLNDQGVELQAKLIWDGNRDRFAGPTRLRAANRDLFQIDTDWSQEFEPLRPASDQVAVFGGARSFEHWHSWQFVIPPGRECVADLSLVNDNGEAQQVRRTLSAGYHLLQLQVMPRSDDTESQIRLRVDDGDEERWNTAPADRPVSCAPVISVLSPGQRLALLRQPMGDAATSLSLQFAGTQPGGRTQSEPAASAVSTNLPWRARGRVVDGQGNPLSGVTIRAATGVGTLLGGGRGVTDADGRYDFRFGMGILMGRNDDGTPSPQTQYALISARLNGHFEQNFNRHGNGIASLEPVSAANAGEWGVEPDQVCLPDRPREVDFVMLPAARVSGTLVDENDRPLKDYSVSLTADELPPGSSVLSQVVTDENGRFRLAEIPTTIPYQFVVRKPRSELKPPWDDSWASSPLRFVEPGEHEFAGSADDPAGDTRIVAKELRLQVVGDGVHGKSAVANAARRGLGPLADSVRSVDGQMTADRLTLLLSNEGTRTHE